jgi:hypothetical protein
MYIYIYIYIHPYKQVALGDLDDMFSSPSPRVKPANDSNNRGTTTANTAFATVSTTAAAAPVEVFVDPPRNGHSSNSQSSNAQNSNGPLDFVMFEDSSSPGIVHVQVVALEVQCYASCFSMLTASCSVQYVLQYTTVACYR